jgi:hypothetical protein
VMRILPEYLRCEFKSDASKSSLLLARPMSLSLSLGWDNDSSKYKKSKLFFFFNEDWTC